ncbi:MAG TPA: MG2 domain-containing protein [Cyclobacteriaceae bacterium]|nr:MG2 domain-containing protein [Cyclobacteriaceae bacterium]
MKKLIYSLATLFILSSLSVGFKIYGDDFLEALKTKLANYNRTYREERIYLQFDKTLYKPGEDIWYKAYVLDGVTLKPSSISTVLYVELIDPRGSIIKKSELQIEEGAAHGDFAIDQKKPGGLYTIRAYTRWMENFSTENFFSRQITIQSILAPRLLLKLDFEKRAYGKNDFVKAHLKARNLKDEPLASAEVKAQLKLSGVDYATKNVQTDKRGEIDLEFQLPDTLKTTDGILQAVVSSDGIEESIFRSVPIVFNKIQVKFFPEGGEAIVGSNGRVAFEAINEFGKGADIGGVITDESGKTVSTFESFHLGMGAFNINAENGHHYSAKITKPEGISEVYPLPVFTSDGMGLAVNQQFDSILVAKVFSSKERQAYLVGHVHSKVFAAEKLQLRAGWNEVKFSTSTMPVGILTLTLFDAEGSERCERLVFVNPNKTLQINLITNRTEYRPGEEVELTIRTSNGSGAAVPSNLSLAVVDDQLLTAIDDKQDNLLSWMLLGGEVKGRIEEPSFYFDETEPKAKEALNLLLMVHGWRRFSWKEVMIPENRILSYLPENESTISGWALNDQNKNSKAEVVLVELANRKRIAKIKTDSNGHFIFKNVDASSPMLLLTKKPNLIEVNGVRSASFEPSDKNYYYEHRRYRVNPLMEVEDQARIETPAPIVAEGNEVNVDLANDVTQLSEMVVTSLGVSESQRALASSVVKISEMPPAFFLSQPIENQLMGRVNGLVISPSVQPGSSPNLQIRGVSTLANRSEPLWVIDGVPMAASINSNFSNGSQLTPGNIRSVTVLKATEATSLFGSAAANGVILVETKSRADYSNFNYVKSKPRYSVLSVKPRTFSMAREFYTSSSKDDNRSNFKSTVFWQHSVVTDKNGEAKIQFHTNDLVSTFRVTAEGMSGNGLIGRKEVTYHALLPFSLDAKLPDYIGFEDTLKIPVRITNNTTSLLNGKITVDLPDQLRSLDELKPSVEVGANQTVTIFISIIPSGISGNFPIKIKLEGERFKDEVSKTINIHAVGFPARVSYSGKDLNKTFDVEMNNVEKGSATGELTFVTDILDDLFAGAEAMLREPHGCFEQVSSSTFPNILALQFLKQTGRSNPAIEKKALDFIDSGYKMLKGYEINSGGFEWFGHPPAHEALTAYGLIEFTEMQKIYSSVDADMLERTKNWLLKRRNGDGTFKQNHGKYGFSSAPAEINNAYIVYALSEAGVKEVELEYNYSLNGFRGNSDMYIGALLANAAINYNKLDDYKFLVSTFSDVVATRGVASMKMKNSVTYSYGDALATETVALWVLALLKSRSPDYKLITDCIEFIGARKKSGMYGSTQATFLALKAVTEYHKLVQSARTDGEIVFSVNHEIPSVKSFTKENKGKILFNEFGQFLKEGNNKLSFAYAGTKEALPFSLDIGWNTKTPQSSEECKLKIDTELKSNSVRMNETVRLSIKLVNKTNTGLPMSMALIGIPAGLSLQPWQLKELKEKEAFDFYEIMGDKLAVYYRELGPLQTKVINLDMKADLPGSFLSTASCAYLYYSSEFKNWVAGSKVTVTP